MRTELRIVVLVAAFAVPAVADASVATTVDGNLHYTAGAGELNNVSFARVSGDTFRVIETGATIQAGQGCTQDNPNQVTCTTAPGHPIIANLGDQNDKAVSKTSRSVQFFGEAGNDRLAGASGRDLIDGGDGNDLVTGGSGRDTVRGGAGDDQVFGGGGNDQLFGQDGMDLLDGGSGNDSESGGAGNDELREDASPDGADILYGGDGIDTADYSLRSAPVRVDINNVRDDGDIRTNERDDVRSSVEVVLGGAGNDQLFGRDGPVDTLVGGVGDDYLDGRRGDDHLDGGPGIDQIATRDLSSDTVACGDGSDSVAADERDLTAADCEKVRRSASMSLRVEGHPFFPTVMLRVNCPRTAFKYCAGKLLLRTVGKVVTRTGKHQLLVGAKRFLLAPGSELVVGVRIRAAVAPFVKRGGLPVRARISGFDGAGGARPAAVRFKLRRR